MVNALSLQFEILLTVVRVCVLCIQHKNFFQGDYGFSWIVVLLCGLWKSAQ